MAEQPLYTNRLIKEKSPYLLQHAHNPVNWFPWSDEAFSEARNADKPIFLSIGYATCHWCHVMENESFENVEVARLMNDVFVNIKIDREELPEVDSLYMEFAQSMMAGAAGWPLNVILTPDLQPFFAATYLPPHSTHGLMGLIELIQRIREVWSSEERERVELQAAKIVEVFSESVHVTGDEIPEKEQIDDAAELLFKMADPVNGGMKGTPKFPIGYQTNFMLRYAAKSKESRAIFLVERTMEMMQRGGIYDHLGGGFHRYSVDEQWFVPHFEKMLYDNALLASAYLETWLVTNRKLYRQVVVEVLNYLIRDMSHPEGGFYSAEDADSEGHEGFFYTWLYDEVQGILGKKESTLFCQFYDIIPEGNFEGRNIIHAVASIEDFAHSKAMSAHDLEILFKLQKQLLWKVREGRPHPLKDDKVLSAWNGLAIYSLAWAGHSFNEQLYINAAANAAHFIKKYLWKDDILLRRWREGESQFEGGLDEYAFLIRGLIALFEINQGAEWLEWALELTEILRLSFKEKNGAYYQTNGQDPNLILRKCQFSDGAEPSGNAIHCENLLKLYRLTNDQSYLTDAEDILKAVKKYIDNYPPGYCYHLMNLNRYYDKKAPVIVIALNKQKEKLSEITDLLNSHFIPHKLVIWRQEKDEKLFAMLPFVKEQGPKDKKTTLYICHEGICEKPLTDFAEMEEAITRVSTS